MRITRRAKGHAYNPPKRGKPSAYKSPKRISSPQQGGGAWGEISGDALNVLLIPLSIFIGIIAQFICGIIYHNCLFSMPRPLLIGLMFLILAVALAVIISVFSHARGHYEDNVLEDYLPFGGNLFATLGILIIALFLAATLFQFLYGLSGVHKQAAPTSYVFVIDESGSMEENDPYQKRYDAIETILKQEDDNFPYMVYGFSDDCWIVREMGEKYLGMEEFPAKGGGGTSIKGTIKQVYKDYDQKVWDGGEHPRVILLTDGYATDMSFNRSISKALTKYRRAGISISTVGLGAVDTGLMEKIARETGGVYIGVEDASQLSTAMNDAAIMMSDRDLVNTRFSDGPDILHAIMRILFLFILGVLIGLIAFAAYGDVESGPLTLLSTFITALLGALFMELGTSVFMWDETWMWRVMWILFALTLTLKHPKNELGRFRNLSDSGPTGISGTGSGGYSPSGGGRPQGGLYR